MTTVLVVDDIAALAEQYAYDLKRLANYETLVAIGGGQALEAIEQEAPDCVVLDLEMPGMDGKKFVDYARAKGLSPRRIVVTSSHSADELHQRFRIGETIAVINKTEAKPHRDVKAGDEIEIQRPFGRKQLITVLGVAEKHIARAEARLLYEDRTPKPTPEEVEVMRMERVYRAAATPPTRPNRDMRRTLRRLKRGE